MRLEIKVLDNEVRQFIKGFSPQVVKRIETRAINAGISATRKATISAITDRYAIKQGKAGKSLIVRRIKSPEQEGKVVVRASPIGLENFKVKQNRFGVIGTIDKKRGSELLRSAFIEEVKGRKIVAVRTRRITSNTKRYVVKPSTLSPHRGTNKSELPINRLLADPYSEVVAPQAVQISRVASEAVTNKLVELAEAALNGGRV